MSLGVIFKKHWRMLLCCHSTCNISIKTPTVVGFFSFLDVLESTPPIILKCNVMPVI